MLFGLFVDWIEPLFAIGLLVVAFLISNFVYSVVVNYRVVHKDNALEADIDPKSLW